MGLKVVGNEKEVGSRRWQVLPTLGKTFRPVRRKNSAAEKKSCRRTKYDFLKAFGLMQTFATFPDPLGSCYRLFLSLNLLSYKRTTILSSRNDESKGIFCVSFVCFRSRMRKIMEFRLWLSETDLSSFFVNWIVDWGVNITTKWNIYGSLWSSSHFIGTSLQITWIRIQAFCWIRIVILDQHEGFLSSSKPPAILSSKNASQETNVTDPWTYETDPDQYTG